MLDGRKKLPGAFKILHGPFVLFRRFARAERSQIPAFSRFSVFFPRIQAVFAGF
jgi:hypothetical protein